MWLAVKNQGQKSEEDYKVVLMDKISQIKDVYLPYIHRVFKDKNGKTHRRYELAIKGYMFVNVDATETRDSNGKRDLQGIWKQLSAFITPGGYLYWYEKENNGDRTLSARRTEPVRLLSPDPKTATPDQLISHSLIPQSAMEYFRCFNEQSLGGWADAFLVNESFNKMARVNDTVRIISGPLAGQEGVIVQEDDGNNRKDRRLVAKFGNSMTVHYPNIRKYNMVVVREATAGDKAKESRLWYIIDRIIGILQAQAPDHADEAPRTLRTLLKHINGLPADDNEGKMRVIQDAIKAEGDPQAKENRRLLFLLSGILPPTTNPNFNNLLAEYIPDTRIRPFLTPAHTANPANPRNGRTISHKDFTEHILPVNLEKAFKEPLDTGIPSPDHDPGESFAYDAHVAVFDLGGGRSKAVVPWGGFYDKYATLTESEKEDFAADLARKGYTHLHALLSTGHPSEPAAPTPPITFDQTKGVGGFSITFSNQADEAISQLVDHAAHAAVEMWQGTRLRVWRQLAQRFVLIHHIRL